MEVITQTVYKDLSGKIHETELACVQADNNIRELQNSTFYFRVHHNFDCTEGRGFYRCSFVKIVAPGRNPSKELARGFVEEYFHNVTRGRVVWIMGVEPVLGYRIAEVTVADWDKAPKEPKRASVGLTTTQRIELAVNEERKVYLVN